MNSIESIVHDEQEVPAGETLAAEAATDVETAQSGVGLSNLRTRLRILHGNQSELHLWRATSGEAEVVVTLPLREA